MIGLTVSQRKAVTKAIATRYPLADMAGKGRILDELCATTGWHRNHARKALKNALLIPAERLTSGRDVSALRLRRQPGCVAGWPILRSPSLSPFLLRHECQLVDTTLTEDNRPVQVGGALQASSL